MSSIEYDHTVLKWVFRKQWEVLEKKVQEVKEKEGQIKNQDNLINSLLEQIKQKDIIINRLANVNRN